MADNTRSLSTKLRFYHSVRDGSFVEVEAMASTLEEIATKERSFSAQAFIEIASALRRTCLRSQNESLEKRNG